MNRSWLALFGLLAALVAIHRVMAEPSEPFFNGDETQHVMTGIFVADAIMEGGLWHPRAYAERYYAQYPALGLIVWPPGFYAVEGVTMLAFGRTFDTARGLMLVYGTLAGFFLFRLVKFTHDFKTALLAVAMFGLTREVFFHTRNVMLEVPTLAFILAALFYLERYLAEYRRRDLVWLAVSCVFAGLHRYDAVALLPVVLLRVAFARQWKLLIRKDVLIAAGIVIVVLAPVYGLAAYEIGSAQQSAAATGSDPATVKASLLSQWTYLPRTLWAQIGQAACAFGVLGLYFSLGDRKAAAYWSLILGSFLFFAPLAEQETRHGISWIPAWCTLAAVAVTRLGTTPLRLTLLSLIAVGGTAYWTLSQPVTWVRGYSTAASLAVQNVRGTGVILFDGLLSGTFIYEIRTQDADRRLWVVRGDKVLYSSLSDPAHGYVEWAKDDESLLKLLEDLCPDLIVVEEPPAKYTTPMAMRLRILLASRSDLYTRVAVIPVKNNNREWLNGVTLVVYRPLKPKPIGERKINIPMLWQNRQIEASVK
ncbi:hypothetical protein BH11PLA2_BH11PLA2_02500 [soil metagenome]